MNKKKKGMIILSILIVILIGLLVYLFIIKNKKEEFYVKVKESSSSSSIVEPLHNEKIYKNYPVLQIDVGNLKEGDIIKVTAKGEVLETYPPVVQVLDYEFIINNTTSTTPLIEIIDELNIPTTTKRITTTQNNNIPTTKVNTTTSRTTTIKINTNTMPSTTTTKYVPSSKDEIVLSSLQNNISLVEKNQNDKSFGEKAKGYFISTVDFIFYDKDIKGVYFKDLTNTAKLKVIGLALKLDNLIDKHYPGYKDSLSSSYQNIKNKLIELYLDKTSEYCANNDKVCKEAKNDFQEFKKAYGITWDFIKNLGSKGISKLKQWYEVYSGK